jgi:hypothetical protein
VSSGSGGGGSPGPAAGLDSLLQRKVRLIVNSLVQCM